MNQKKRILIVDDDFDFAAAIARILTTANYDVEKAGSLQEGLKAIQKREPDLILLDVMMEKYDDGFNMCYDLKHDERYKHIPVIMITAVTEVTGLKFNPDTDGEYLQAEGYLRKPIKAELLLERVASLV
jgi:CheY-like chemotaxis protein